MKLIMKYKLVFIPVTVSIPFWILLFANRFPLHLNVAIALICEIGLNLYLFLILKSKERKTGGTA